MKLYEIGARPVETGIDPVTVVAVVTTAARVIDAINGPDKLDGEKARIADLTAQLTTVERTLADVRRDQAAALTAATAPRSRPLPDLARYAKIAALAGAAGVAALAVFR